MSTTRARDQRGDAGGSLTPEQRAAIERWFIHRGIPHFIAGYNAREDVLTRALPFLTVIFVIEVVLALRSGWPWWANTLAFGGGAAFLFAGWALSNRLRGRRLLQRPDNVGPGEIATFVLVPSFLPVVFGGELLEAVGAIVGNLVLLGLAYYVTSYGLVPMVRWALLRIFTHLRDLAELALRALPLMLLFATFLFINAEIWQVAAGFTPTYFWATIGLLVGVGTLFFLVRLPREVEALRSFASWDEVAADLGDAPLRPALVTQLAGEPDPAPLTRRDWFNVGLLLIVSQGLQILLVAVVIGLFYVAFGLVAVREATITAWTGEPIRDLYRLSLWGAEVVLTRELLQVAGFIAAFSGLQFTVSALTDDHYRREFIEDIVAEVREAFAARAAYLACLATPVLERR